MKSNVDTKCYKTPQKGTLLENGHFSDLRRNKKIAKCAIMMKNGCDSHPAVLLKLIYGEIHEKSKCE
jgi:hypothetical protein